MRRLCVLLAGLCLFVFAASAEAYGKTRADLYPQEIAVETLRQTAALTRCAACLRFLCAGGAIIAKAYGVRPSADVPIKIGVIR